MSDHDPLCRYPTFPMTGPDACDCELIAKVRADERARCEDRTEGLLHTLLTYRTDLRAQVNMLGVVNRATADFGEDYGIAIDDVLALIDGSQP
jgi:hypothetical protein